MPSFAVHHMERTPSCNCPRRCLDLPTLSQVLSCCVVQARYPLPLQVGLPVSIAIFAFLEGARYRNWLSKGEGGEWPGPHRALHLFILLHRLYVKPWRLPPACQQADTQRPECG